MIDNIQKGKPETKIAPSFFTGLNTKQVFIENNSFLEVYDKISIVELFFNNDVATNKPKREKTCNRTSEKQYLSLIKHYSNSNYIGEHYDWLLQ